MVPSKKLFTMHYFASKCDAVIMLFTVTSRTWVDSFKRRQKLNLNLTFFLWNVGTECRRSLTVAADVTAAGSLWCYSVTFNSGQCERRCCFVTWEAGLGAFLNLLFNFHSDRQVSNSDSIPPFLWNVEGSSSSRNLFLTLTIFEAGCYVAELSYDGQTVKNGCFDIIVLTCEWKTKC